MLMTRDLLRTELAGLEIKIAQEVDREIHEGKGHNGKSAVVQFVARKPRR
jgi:RNase P/RNase MRP subunit p29